MMRYLEIGIIVVLKKKEYVIILHFYEKLTQMGSKTIMSFYFKKESKIKEIYIHFFRVTRPEYQANQTWLRNRGYF